MGHYVRRGPYEGGGVPDEGGGVPDEGGGGRGGTEVTDLNNHSLSMA